MSEDGPAARAAGRRGRPPGATAARIGAGACLLALGLIATPYAVVDAAEIGVYYGVGPVGPPFLALFTGVALVVLASGAAGRSDPATGAGVATAFTVVAAVLGVAWALAAGEVVGGLTVGAWFDWHRWALVAANALALLGAAAYARAVL